MPEPPRRGRFQVHLSTAVVMMFVAGVLVWINTMERTHDFGEFPWNWHVSDYGWPAPALHSKHLIREGTSKLISPKYEVIYGLAAVDVFLAAFILFAVWFLCEWLIRRRAARKGT